MLHPHFLIIAHITNTYRSVQQLFGADDDNNTDAADASNIGMIEKKKHIKKEPMKNCTLTVYNCYAHNNNIVRASHSSYITYKHFFNIV